MANKLTFQARETKKEIDAFKLNTKGQAPRQRSEAFAMPLYGTSLAAAHELRQRTKTRGSSLALLVQVTDLESDQKT